MSNGWAKRINGPGRFFAYSTAGISAPPLRNQEDFRFCTLLVFLKNTKLKPLDGVEFLQNFSVRSCIFSGWRIDEETGITQISVIEHTPFTFSSISSYSPSVSFLSSLGVFHI